MHSGNMMERYRDISSKYLMITEPILCERLGSLVEYFLYLVCAYTVCYALRQSSYAKTSILLSITINPPFDTLSRHSRHLCVLGLIQKKNFRKQL